MLIYICNPNKYLNILYLFLFYSSFDSVDFFPPNIDVLTENNIV